MRAINLSMYIHAYTYIRTEYYLYSYVCKLQGRGILGNKSRHNVPGRTRSFLGLYVLYWGRRGASAPEWTTFNVREVTVQSPNRHTVGPRRLQGCFSTSPHITCKPHGRRLAPLGTRCGPGTFFMSWRSGARSCHWVPLHGSSGCAMRLVEIMATWMTLCPSTFPIRHYVQGHTPSPRARETSGLGSFSPDWGNWPCDD